MHTIQDQLELEDSLISHGASRYLAGIKTADDKERSADTLYGQRLIRVLIRPLADNIEDFKQDGPRRFGKYAALIKDMDSQLIAFIGIKTVLNMLHTSKTIRSVCLEIGKCLEDELRFSEFRKTCPQYFKSLVQEFEKKNTRSYRHRRNVLSVVSQKRGFKWSRWGEEERMMLGSMVLEKLMETTDLVEHRRRYNTNKPGYIYVLVPTQECIDWIKDFNEYASGLHPYTKPCIIPPAEWTSIHEGGYWSDPMRFRTPLIKGLSGFEEKFVADHDLSVVYKAVNNLQNVAWSINTRVLDTLIRVWDLGMDVGLPSKEPINIPKFKVQMKQSEMSPELREEWIEWKAVTSRLYTKESMRLSKSYALSRTITMAQEYSQYDKFWYVYQCDFRGRVYASTSALSPQGADFNRGLLMFAEGKPLGDEGFNWLRIHGANCYGVDKVPFKERIKWIDDHHDELIATANDPVGYSQLWRGADKPFQFLAFCLEYAEAYLDPKGFVSHLPVGMDGSCNGLQNFSALLRDAVGGAATNLIDSDRPADIYQEVANRALQLIQEDGPSEQRTLWLSFADKHKGLPRGLAKRSVMTLPYGSTKYSSLNFVSEALEELDSEFFKTHGEATAYLTDKIWTAISDVVIAARDAMDWLQETSRQMAKHNHAIWWITPTGFPVFQSNKVQNRKRLRTMLMGDIALSMNTDTNKVSSRKQAQGVAPNFVHSLDAAHMMFVTNQCVNEDIESLCMVHDDFGTHACDVPALNRIIREEFVIMYGNYSPLEDLKEICEMTVEGIQIPDIPPTGDLELGSILNSTYFFA